MLIYSNYTYIQVLDDAMTIKLLNRQINLRKLGYEKEKKLLIIGSGEFAEIAYEYFTYDSEYDVVGFAVEKEYLNKEELFGKKIVEFENILKMYPPQQYYVFVAITYNQLNRVRRRLYRKCKIRL